MSTRVRFCLICCLFVTGFVLAHYNHNHKNEVPGPAAEIYIPDSGSVGFDLAPVQKEGQSWRWMATYTAQGKTAKFLIELGPAKDSSSKDAKDFEIKTGAGRFVAVPGSDASNLIVDLAKALEAKKVPAKAKRVHELPFQFANLGDNLSQAADGGFNENPAGHWTAMKIFLGEGERESEVFLNLNEAIGKGQFSIKDIDYGDLVLAELAQVL